MATDEKKPSVRMIIPHEEAVTERRAYVGLLKTQGLARHAIIQHVNALSGEKGWGKISRDVYYRDIRAHFNSRNKQSVKDYLETEDSLLESQLDFYEARRADIISRVNSTRLLRKAHSQANAILDTGGVAKVPREKPMSDFVELGYYGMVLQYSDKIDELKGWKRSVTQDRLFANNNQDALYERAREESITPGTTNIASKLAELIRESCEFDSKAQQPERLVIASGISGREGEVEDTKG